MYTVGAFLLGRWCEEVVADFVRRFLFRFPTLLRKVPKFVMIDDTNILMRQRYRYYLVPGKWVDWAFVVLLCRWAPDNSSHLWEVRSSFSRKARLAVNAFTRHATQPRLPCHLASVLVRVIRQVGISIWKKKRKQTLRKIWWDRNYLHNSSSQAVRTSNTTYSY